MAYQAVASYSGKVTGGKSSSFANPAALGDEVFEISSVLLIWALLPRYLGQRSEHRPGYTGISGVIAGISERIPTGQPGAAYSGA
jgi:hypothetical protein